MIEEIDFPKLVRDMAYANYLISKLRKAEGLETVTLIGLPQPLKSSWSVDMIADSLVQVDTIHQTLIDDIVGGFHPIIPTQRAGRASVTLTFKDGGRLHIYSKHHCFDSDLPTNKYIKPEIPLPCPEEGRITRMKELHNKEKQSTLN